MATSDPQEARVAFERPANPDGQPGGYVVLRNGEATLVDWLNCHESHIAYGLGAIARRKPWDLVETADVFLDDADVAEYLEDRDAE